MDTAGGLVLLRELGPLSRVLLLPEGLHADACN